MLFCERGRNKYGGGIELMEAAMKAGIKKGRPRMWAVPKKSFSEHFLEMPEKKRVEVKNRLRLEAISLLAEAEKLADDVHVFINSMQIPKNIVNLTKLKSKRHKFWERRNALMRRFSKIEGEGRTYFRKFSPKISGLGGRFNPVEIAVHEAYKLRKEFDDFFNTVKGDIEIFEKNLVKRKH